MFFFSIKTYCNTKWIIIVCIDSFKCSIYTVFYINNTLTLMYYSQDIEKLCMFCSLLNFYTF